MRVRIRREPPSAKAYDALDALQFEQPVKLLLKAANIDFPVLGDIAKGPVHVRVVVVHCHLGDVHVGAAAVEVPGLEIPDAPWEFVGGVVVCDLGATVGDASVCAGFGGTRGSVVDVISTVSSIKSIGLNAECDLVPAIFCGVGAELRSDAALAPDVAAGIERTRV